MRAAAAAALVLSAAGCNSILGIGDVHSSTGSPDAGGGDAPMFDAPPAPTCPTPATGQVVGCWFDDYVQTDLTTITAAHDLTGATIQAFVADSSSTGFAAPLTATIVGPGVFTIDDVPSGPYYLHIGTSYYVTDQRTLDLGYVTIGRLAPTPVTEQTPITLDLGNMTAWQSSDYLLVDSFAVDTENFSGLYEPAQANMPKVGDTSLGETVDWQTSYSYLTAPMLVDASHHDDAWIVHVTSPTISDTANHPYVINRVAEVYMSTNVPMADGKALTVTGSFGQVGNAMSETFSADLAGLRAAIPSGGRYTWDELSCALLTNPAAEFGNGIGPGIAGIDGDPSQNFTPSSQTSVTFPAIPFGNPYPTAWPIVVPCSLEQYRWPVAPSAGPGNPVPHSVQIWDAYNGASYQFAAAGHAPSSITIDGKSTFLAGGAVAFDGTSPVALQWATVPNTDSYAVQVREIVADVGNTDETAVATFTTTQTTLAIPAAVFQKDHLYVFSVFETRQNPTYSTGHINRQSTPSSSGRVASGVFRLSNDCGNHTVDGTEECDTGGDSATCDADCSKVVCGDGYVNTAAGEQCDDVFDSPTCNSGTCMTSVCGDGYVNANAGEQCDDGNLTDGDGCNHLCQLEHCGDGKLDPYEGCDDGNTKNGDGCNAFCQIEGGWTCDTSKNPSVCTQ